MTDQTRLQDIDPAELPEPVAAYVQARGADDTDAAIGRFAPDATVVDEGHTYVGAAQIRDWLGRSASEYTYTITPVAHQRLDATHYVVTQHLEGNFPGGQVDLRYQFTLADGLIVRLVIEP
jgi:hypothetical protein